MEQSVILHTVETGSFTAAARRLGLTMNATSRRLAQLETALGVKLIERTTRRSSATDAGARLQQRVGPIPDALLNAEAELQSSDAEVEGVVTVALPAVVVGSTFLARLQRLMHEHPGLRVDLRVGARHLAGVDLAIVVGDAPKNLALVQAPDRRAPLTQPTQVSGSACGPRAS